MLRGGVLEEGLRTLLGERRIDFHDRIHLRHTKALHLVEGFSNCRAVGPLKLLRLPSGLLEQAGHQCGDVILTMKGGSGGIDREISKLGGHADDH